MTDVERSDVTPGVSAELATARDLIIAAQPVAALQKLASVSTSQQHDKAFYELAFEAMVAATATPKTLLEWRGSEKGKLYETLLLQAHCDARPFVFHHSIASLISSQQAQTATAIIVEVEPVLNRLLNADDAGKAITLFALVARSRARGRLPRERIRKLHFHHFPAFDSHDLALPYSTVFNAGAFGENRDELLTYYSREVALQPAAGLKLTHLLLLEWLGCKIFTDPDNADLVGAIVSQQNSIHEGEQHAAARSLMLRHGRPGNSTLQHLSAKYSMSDVLLYLEAEEPGREVASRPTRVERALQSKPLMAIRALQAIARPYLPSVVTARKRLRIAVCVSGQLRGFRRAAATWDRLFPPEIEADVYVHTWSTIGRSSAAPFRTILPFDAPAFCETWRRLGSREGPETTRERYPTLFQTLKHSASVTLHELASVYRTTPDRAVIEDDDDEPFQSYSNSQKMHYKICAAFELAQSRSCDYDLHVRIRPDLGIRYAAFSWRDLLLVCQSRPVMFCERGFGVHYGNPMIGDQFAIGSPEAMQRYAHAWTTYPLVARLQPAQCPPQFEGHITLAQVLWFNNIDALRAPIAFSGLIDAEKLSAAEIRQAIHSDAAQRHDATDAAYLEALTRDLSAARQS